MRAYDAALDYELGLLAQGDRHARIARPRSSGAACTSRSPRARPAASSTARRRAQLSSAALASFSRAPVALPVRVDAPHVTVASLAARSAPRLAGHLGAGHARRRADAPAGPALAPREAARPRRRCGSLGPAADALLRAARAHGRPRRRRTPTSRSTPTGRAASCPRAAGHRARRAAVGRGRARRGRAARRIASRRSCSRRQQPELTTAAGAGDGDHGHGRQLRDALRRRPEPDPQRPARRPPRRPQADRAGHDVLVQRHDRRALRRRRASSRRR